MIQKPLFTLPALFFPMTVLCLATTARANQPPVIEIATLAPAPAQANTRDTAFRQALLGTWQAVDRPTATSINGEGTFTADGKASGYTTATYVYKDGYTSDVKITMNFQWRVENGVITLDKFVSDPAGFIKTTQVKQFEIKSMTSDSLVLKDLADGEEVYRRRKPG